MHALITQLNADLSASGCTPLDDDQAACLSDPERTDEARGMLADLQARCLNAPSTAAEQLADAINRRPPFWITCGSDAPQFFTTYTDAAEALAGELRSNGAMFDREGEPHRTAELNAAAEEVENSSNRIDAKAAGIRYTLNAYEPSDRAAAIDELSAAFCTILRATIGDEAADTCARINATLSNPHVCASHDYCDANEVMSAAWLQVWRREAMTMDDDDANAWNAAWNQAKAAGFSLGV